MTKERAMRLAAKWANGGVCTLREGEAQEYHELCLKALRGSKWIPVSERLPEDERSVLAYYGFGHAGTPDSDMMFTGVLSYFCFDPEPHWQHAGHGVAVTHWMPLPEPPDMGDENQ